MSKRCTLLGRKGPNTFRVNPPMGLDQPVSQGRPIKEVAKGCSALELWGTHPGLRNSPAEKVFGKFGERLAVEGIDPRILSSLELNKTGPAWIQREAKNKAFRNSSASFSVKRRLNSRAKVMGAMTGNKKMEHPQDGNLVRW